MPSAVRCRAALVLVVALLAGACGSGSKPAAAEPPATVLARITSFVKAHRTARFTATEYAGGGDDSYVNQLSGEVDLPGTWHEVRQTNYHRSESIGIGGKVFGRKEAADPWATEGGPIEGSATLAPLEVGLAGASTTPGQVLGLLQALGRVAHLTAVSPTVLRATFRPRQLVTAEQRKRVAGLERVSREIFQLFLDGQVTVTLRHDAHGRLDSVSLRGVVTPFMTRGNTHNDIRFTRWGEPVSIAAPASVDPTPDIDEAALAAFPHGPLLAPVLPGEFGLVAGRVPPRDEGEELCQSAWLTYGLPGATPLDEGIIQVVVLEPSCPFPADYGIDFRAGEHRRFGRYDAVLVSPDDVFDYTDIIDGGVSASVELPQSLVLVTTDLGDAVLARAVETLHPFVPAPPAGPAT